MPAEPDFETAPDLTFDAIVTGRRYRLGTIELTRDAVIAFAREWDPQPFHLSDEAAAANPVFGRLSASGWHTVMLMHAQIDRFSRASGLEGLAGSGVDEISWIKPVFPPARLPVFLSFTQARPSRSRPGVGVASMCAEAFHDTDGLVARLSITGLFARGE